MTPERIEKLFWLMILAWFLVRTSLLFAQYSGNTDPVYHTEILKYFTQADIDSGREYAMKGFWFKSLYGLFFVFLLLAMLRTGFFGRLFDFSVRLTGAGFWLQNLVFTVLFLLLIQILSLPSSFYFGYWREAEAGFANAGILQWLVKYLKTILLSISLETFAVMLMIVVVKFFPGRWPILVPAALGLLSAVVTLLLPVVITPLFYEQKPLEAGVLRDRLLQIAEDSGMKIEEIYVVDESRYSKHTNAYFTGFGSFRRIVLYDNLISSHTPEEVALIFAHEAGHWRYNHVAWGLSLGTIGALLSCLVVFYAFPSMAGVKWFGLKEIASSANLPFFMIVFLVGQLLFSPVENQISQFMERQADRVALELTGLGEVYVNAQIRLSRDNRSDLLPSPFRVFWLYSHPPALERIKMAGDFSPASHIQDKK